MPWNILRRGKFTGALVPTWTGFVIGWKLQQKTNYI